MDDVDVVIRPKPSAERSISTVSNGTALELSMAEEPGTTAESTAVPGGRSRLPRTKEEIELSNLKKKTRKRTRRFEVDGVVVTTTTSKVRGRDGDPFNAFLLWWLLAWLLSC